HVRVLALARRADGGGAGRGDHLRLLGRPDRRARVLRADAAADGRNRRCLHRAGPVALLRLLGGDADPALRADRRLGRPGATRRDDQVLHLHDGGLAADARLDHRARALAGHVRPDRDLSELERLDLPGFVAAFAVKAPLFPLHGWLPDAYRESPAEVSAVLSGLVSKAAIYGFIRIAITKFPEPTKDFRTVILVLAAIGLIYGSLLAFRAPDIPGVIAYSSLAQLGLITFGVFAVNDLGLNGAVLQMVNHGLISAALFLLAGGIERRATTGDFSRLGGFARGRPLLATVLMTTGI